jgi:DNA replication protein DnaC
MTGTKRFEALPASEDSLALQLRSLGLYVIAERYAEVADEATRTKSPYTQYLGTLVSAQLSARMDRSFRERLARARFPAYKTVEEFNFSFQPGVDERLVRTLATLQFLKDNQNVLLVGPPGVGKTHLAIALGVRACQERKRVAFYGVQELLDHLAIAHATGLLPQKLVELARLNMLILDELGYLTLDTLREHLFFQLVNRLYEKGSIVLTTNRRFESWAEIFAGDGVIAGAILDRLLHLRQLLAINGTSYRTADLVPAAVPKNP